MKAPIHIRCARSGELCQECRKKLESGLVSELDLKVIRTLSEIEEKHKLNEIIYKKSFKIDTIVFILLESDVSQLIGKHGKILKEIKRELDSKVRLINAKSREKIIEDILFPVKPVYTSIVFKPEGKVLKLVIPKDSSRKLGTRKEILERALEKILGMESIILEE